MSSVNFLKKISKCQQCNLYKNQCPLLDKQAKGNVLWLGLSAKGVEKLEEGIPLDNNTNTGKLIEKVEKLNAEVDFYKTNLVKCLPLSSDEKLRYPSSLEMDTCYSNFEKELAFLKPKLVFLLGGKVSHKVLKQKFQKKPSLDKEFKYEYYILDGIKYIPIHHPSYIHIYKRKRMEDYILSLSSIIQSIRLQ